MVIWNTPRPLFNCLIVSIPTCLESFNKIRENILSNVTKTEWLSAEK